MYIKTNMFLSMSLVSTTSFLVMLLLVAENNSLLKTTRKKHLIVRLSIPLVQILLSNTSFFMLSLYGTLSNRFSSASSTMLAASDTISASLPLYGSPRTHFTTWGVIEILLPPLT